MAELRSALARALDDTESLLGSEVSLETDYYWHLPVQDAFDMTVEPSSLVVGQVRDDLEETLDDEQDRLPEVAWHELQHIIGVLRALELAARP